VGKHHGIKPGELLQHKQQPKCCNNDVQEHSTFGHPHFRMLQVNCLLQSGKHFL